MPSTLSHSVLRPHATIIVNDPELPHEIQRDVLQCCHCQRVWVVVAGSGRQRGFCVRCMGPTCGSKACAECVPFEKRLDLYEAGKLLTL